MCKWQALGSVWRCRRNPVQCHAAVADGLDSDLFLPLGVNGRLESIRDRDVFFGEPDMTKTRGFRGDSKESAKRQALLVSAEALHKAAERKLPRPLERKIKKMLEEKESLSDREHKELLTLVELAQGQLLHKVRAEVALKLLEKAYPELKGQHWRASASGSVSK
jgi:hypothetical protein